MSANKQIKGNKLATSLRHKFIKNLGIENDTKDDNVSADNPDKTPKLNILLGNQMSARV